MTTRRTFLGTLPAGLLTSAYAVSGAAAEAAVKLVLSPVQAEYRPLDEVTIQAAGAGRVVVLDGDGQSYFELEGALPITFPVGGALGTHTVLLFDAQRHLLGHASLFVDTRTSIREESGVYQHLLETAYWTMVSEGFGARRYDGKVYRFWDDWVLDNTNSLKGMRYFSDDVKSSTEIFTVTQREDGMIWENYVDRTPPESYWDFRFQYADCSRSVDDGFVGLRRAPVENHVEPYYLEALYLVWKTTGDDAWMKQQLDPALRAVRYSTTDPYRWSKKFGLLKRGLTIDTWDFLCESEAELSGNIMVIDLEKTHFGAFFGDNTEMIAGCRNLAQMLERAGRAKEAKEMRGLAGQMEERLNGIAWNGRFYTHWVAEDESFHPDLGVDMSTQVSLSNAYSLNRGIGSEQAHGIIESYRRIRGEMPATSPGEFYSIYPPFGKGFGREQRQWDYVNGGVLACTAGELARGCFAHGEELYGADILRRVDELTRKHRDYLPGILRGKQLEAPETNYTPLDLTALANCDTGDGGVGVPGWVNDKDGSLIDFPMGRQSFRGVPFQIADGLTNGHRVCLGISETAPYAQTMEVPVHRKCRSFYLLHAGSGAALAGKLTVKFKDGSRQVEYMQQGVNVGTYWAPEDTQYNIRSGPLRDERMQVAWRGKSVKIQNVGVWITSFEPKHVDIEIESMEMESVETGAKWFVIGLTLSDQPPFLPPWTDVSTGMPNNWGAGCVTAALIEGLGGVEDTASGFREVTLSPRWLAANVSDARVDVRYPAGRGYVSYRYRRTGEKLELECTSCADRTKLRILLPQGSRARDAQLNEKHVVLRMERAGESQYVVVDVGVRGVCRLEIWLANA